MAKTTFNGPVRSENGFKTIVKSATTGALTNEMTFSQLLHTVTVVNGDITGKDADGIPSNFIPMGVMIAVKVHQLAVNLLQISEQYRCRYRFFVDGTAATDM